MRASSIKYFFLFIIVAGFFSCKKSADKLSPLEYVPFVDDPGNGYVKEKKFKGLKFRLLQQPVEYLAAKAILSQHIKGKGELGNYIASRNDLQYYLLEISNERINADLLLEGAADQNEYLRRVNYYSYEFEHDIQLSSEGKTIPCSLFHYENSYGGTPSIRFLLAFHKTEKERTVVINEKIFNNGTIKFEFDDPAKAPKLNY